MKPRLNLELNHALFPACKQDLVRLFINTKVEPRSDSPTEVSDIPRQFTDTPTANRQSSDRGLRQSDSPPCSSRRSPSVRLCQACHPTVRQLPTASPTVHWHPDSPPTVPPTALCFRQSSDSPLLSSAPPRQLLISCYTRIILYYLALSCII